MEGPQTLPWEKNRPDNSYVVLLKGTSPPLKARGLSVALSQKSDDYRHMSVKVKVQVSILSFEFFRELLCSWHTVSA